MIVPTDFLALSEEEQEKFMRAVNKHNFIERKRKEYERELEEIYEELKKLQDSCNHLIVQDFGHHTFKKCVACKKSWTETGTAFSNAQHE